MPTAQALIIDDTLTNALVLQQLLMMEGVASVTISNTKDFRFQLDSISNIDIVFLDLEMPFVDGYDAIRLIKAHPNFKASKVIAYSVHVSELHNALDMEFDGFLGKPLNAEEFPQQLARILGGEEVWYLP